MKFRYLVATTLALSATAALAHTGVKNAAVMARMNGMSAIADNVKVLGTMAKGQIAFNATTAQTAARVIARHAGESVALFTPQESDPKSEALPAIWDNFDDFTAKAQALEVLADNLAETISSVEEVRTAMRPLGENCKACHAVYRE